ncbi:uncharacterized protein ALTATR162_LOCUS960 [Alternaria atra]|uniref:Uncharacterized protein n=1 Tax=Alternaria atra TaxID=119953 RepID=A0A8J2HVX4_9PLEO|nr:uncharacterized protein ALTATR162_LOCUS960 [Alternaria atra]CAG5141522.1 unnamed protein product [Alternaria atra]
MDAHKEFIKDSMRQAFYMAEASFEAVGSPPASGGDAWTFPGAETRDMSARIFGVFGAPSAEIPIPGTKQMETVNKYQVVRDTLGWLLAKYRNDDDEPRAIPPDLTGRNDINERLREGDILLYCDLERYTKKNDGTWFNFDNYKEADLTAEEYDDCQNPAEKTAYTAAYVTVPQAGRMVPIQICPGDANKETVKSQLSANIQANLKYEKKTLDDITGSPTGSLLQKLDTLCMIRKKTEPNPDSAPIINQYRMFDATMLHELTHAVHPQYPRIDQEGNSIAETDPVNLQYPKRRPTRDVDTGKDISGAKGGYYWKNVNFLKDNSGRMNADSFAFYGVGARFLKEKGYRILKSGCTEKIKGEYSFATELSGTNIQVDGTWTMPQYKRDLFGFENPLAQSSFAKAPHQSSISPPYPMERRNVSYIIGSASIMTTRTIFAATSYYIPTSAVSLAPPLSSAGTNISSVHVSDRPSGSPSSPGSFGISSTVGTLMSSRSSGLNLASTSAFSFLAGSSTTGTGVSIPITDMFSSTASTTDLAGLISSFWQQTLTTAPVPTREPSSLDVEDLFCTHSLLVGCIAPSGFSFEQLMTATNVAIPTITDISIFPHINVQGVDVVKMSLPTDICNPIPKPSGDGLLGGIFKFGGNIVNGIIDSACNIELPVVKGGHIPKWFNFGKFPHPSSFPPAPDGSPTEAQDPIDPEDPEDPTESPDSSSISCTQTAFVSCRDKSNVLHNKLLYTIYVLRNWIDFNNDNNVFKPDTGGDRVIRTLVEQ